MVGERVKLIFMKIYKKTSLFSLKIIKRYLRKWSKVRDRTWSNVVLCDTYCTSTLELLYALYKNISMLLTNS